MIIGTSHLPEDGVPQAREAAPNLFPTREVRTVRRQRPTLVALALIILVPAVAQSAAEYTPLRDSATGRVVGLQLVGYEAGAGKAEAALAPATVTVMATDFVLQQAELLGVSPAAADLVPQKARVDRLGLGHQRFALRQQGLPVYGGEVYVHVDPTAGVYYATASPPGAPPASVVPTVDAEGARSICRAWAAPQVPDGLSVEADAPVLVILPLRVAGHAGSAESRLTWHVRVATADPMVFDEQCFVDAGTGEMLFGVSNHRRAVRKVYDCAAWPGTLSCYIDQYGGYFPPQGHYYFGRSELAPPRGPYPRSTYPLYYGSLDVDRTHDLFGVNHSYWLNNFGRDGANYAGGLGRGTTIPLADTWGYVHANNTNPTYCPDSAWYGSSNSAIAFCRSMPTPDLLAHEYAHGTVFFMFTDNGSPVGTVFSGETGSLEESFCDMAGEGVEKAALGDHDWHFGVYQSVPPGTYPSTSYGLMRDIMDPPSLHGSSPSFPQPYPDRFYSPNVYCGTWDSGGTHHNSTIPSYAFYLMSEGGSFNGCQINPIGFEASQQILYRAWESYFTRTVTFNEAYFALQQAAADLYPQAVVDQVRIALQAVEMDQPGLCSGLPPRVPGCAGASAVEVDPELAAAVAAIRSCGPNPSFGMATIQYALGHGGDVQLEIFDLSGRRVALVVNEPRERGLHEAQWRDRHVASGVYLVRLTVGGRLAATHKLVVVR